MVLKNSLTCIFITILNFVFKHEIEDLIVGLEIINREIIRNVGLFYNVFKTKVVLTFILVDIIIDLKILSKVISSKN